MTNKKVLLLALIFGLLTAVAVNFYLKSLTEATSNAQIRRVAVAAARIPARTLVTADMISFKNIPVEFVHSNAVSDASRLVGFTTRAEVEAGEQMLSSKLAPKQNSGSSLAYTVPLGLRAISVAVNEQSGVAGLLTPGDRVDVIGTVDVEEQSKDPNVKNVKHTMTHLILQNIEVLAVGKNYLPADTQSGDKKAQSEGTTSVTLAVPPDKTQYLVAITDKGKLTLALRSPADKSEENRPPIDAGQLLK